MADQLMDDLRDAFYPAGTPCPSCQRPTKFHRIRTRAAYGCSWCGHQVYPTVGTIFEKTTQPLANWTQAIEVMENDPNITIMELADQVGVSYKTARRMRELVAGDLGIEIRRCQRKT